MDRWMDGQTDKQIDRIGYVEMDGWMDGWMDGRMDGWHWMELDGIGQMDGSGQIDRQMDR